MDVLTLPVSYNGQELEFPFRIVPQGFAYRFVVLVDEQEVTYERDDAGQLRAVLTHSDAVSGKQPDAGLVSAIGTVIAGLLE